MAGKKFIKIGNNRFVVDKSVVDKAQANLINQVLTNSEDFVPMDTGTLKNSAGITLDKKAVSWNTQYAAANYKGGRKNKDGVFIPFTFRTTHHPKATSKWVETARNKYIRQWIRLSTATLMGKL